MRIIVIISLSVRPAMRVGFLVLFSRSFFSFVIALQKSSIRQNKAIPFLSQHP